MRPKSARTGFEIILTERSESIWNDNAAKDALDHKRSSFRHNKETQLLATLTISDGAADDFLQSKP